MNVFLLAFGTGLLGGLLVAGLSKLMERLRMMREAEGEAKALLEHAQDTAQSLDAEVQSRVTEYREELQEKFETETEKLVQRNSSRTSRLQEKEELLKSHWSSQQSTLDRRQSAIDQRDQMLKARDAKLDATRNRLQDLKQKFKLSLVPQSGESIETLKAQIAQRLESESQQIGQRLAQQVDDNIQMHVEREAKNLIDTALHRFARPYCPERGIGNVDFETVEAAQRFIGPNRQTLEWVEKACGVDINFNEQYLSLAVLGFDPVRRELGRFVLARLKKERQINEKLVLDVTDRTKRDLFKKIAQDGQRVSNELGLKGFHREILNMLGALRYRYSFAQNQHFHCAEVGWLCGLLSSEMNEKISDGRRSGLLHDIGKAMDHSKDGGHAVIGADFIEKHGEQPHIVHNVKAHHFDEQPATDMAYLVIAADAISGARPGARRSTMDSYTQKMADLEKIAMSFEGVTAAYILSAGREVRIIVDSARIDDHKALELSKSIAHKIEEECSYPGLIKITTVRETQAVEFAR